MEAVAGGLPRLLAWCRVVRLDASGAYPAGGGLRVCAGGISACARARSTAACAQERSPALVGLYARVFER